LSLVDPSSTGDVLADSPHFSPDMSATQLELERYLVNAGFRSRVSLPLRGSGQVIGALLFLWAGPSGYARVNFNLLSQLTDAVALAIDKGRLFAETLRRAEELQALTEISAALRMVESVAAVTPILVEHSRAVLRADGGALAVPAPPPDDGLILVYDSGSPESAVGRKIPLTESIVGNVFRTGQPYRTDDLVRDPLAHSPIVQMWAHEPYPRTAIFAPLRAGGAIVGIISITAAAPRRFTDSDLQLLTAIAEMGGNALQRARILDTLEQRVAERTRELEQANERLKELDRLKDIFISTVSHELRTPLTAIKLHLGLLEKRGAELLPRYLPVLQRETERLRKLIEDLLDLSRLRSQTQPLHRELYRLDTLMAEVLTVHGTRAEERGIRLVHVPNADVPLIAIDVGQITQVFTNLIGNAVTYTPEGGRVTLTSALASSGEWEGVTVSVHNDGPPIAPDDLPYLFTRFYRGKTARDSGEPGTGLGLAICKEIVERHAGYIEAASTNGQGTTLTVWLPLRGEVEEAG
jgi:signal transduction histidine kinase